MGLPYSIRLAEDHVKILRWVQDEICKSEFDTDEVLKKLIGIEIDLETMIENKTDKDNR